MIDNWRTMMSLRSKLLRDGKTAGIERECVCVSRRVFAVRPAK